MSLRIVVCVKYVPDATGDRRFADDHTTDREGVDGLLSELDEYGVEQALRIAEAHGDAEVTVLTVGPDDAKDALRKALSMGADKAVHVNDDNIHGSDVMATSAIVAKALERTGFDLVVGGMASTDGTMGVLPAVVSVTDQSGEARYPSFKGIMAAKKKPVAEVTLADLGIDAGDVGIDAAWTKVAGFEARPPRSAGTIVNDEDGTGADQLVEFLAGQKFI